MSNSFLMDYLGYYIEQLGLKWKVEFIVQPNEITRINSFKGQHTIICSSEQVGDTNSLQEHRLWNPILGSLIHELCHGFLAENIDTIFSGSKFFLSQKEMKKNEHKIQLFVSIDCRIIDVWVNDVFIEFFPEIFKKHIRVLGIKARQVGGAPFGSVAKYYAETRRHNLPFADLSGVSNFPHYHGEDKWGWDTVNKFARFLENLPKLQLKKEEDISTYQRANRDAAVLLGYQINPRLKKGDGILVWEVK